MKMIHFFKKAGPVYVKPGKVIDTNQVNEATKVFLYGEIHNFIPNKQTNLGYDKLVCRLSDNKGSTFKTMTEYDPKKHILREVIPIKQYSKHNDMVPYTARTIQSHINNHIVSCILKDYIKDGEFVSNYVSSKDFTVVPVREYGVYFLRHRKTKHWKAFHGKDELYKYIELKFK